MIAKYLPRLTLRLKPVCMSTSVPLYFEHPYQFTLSTRISRVHPENKVEFAETIVHPKGGGQPSDMAHIMVQDRKVNIEGVNVAPNGQVTYTLGVTPEPLKEGDKIKIVLNQRVRLENMYCHSAGHLIDLAVHRLGYKWSATKGSHVPAKAYVEYTADRPLKNPQEVKQALNDQIDVMLTEEIPITQAVYKPEAAKQLGLVDEKYEKPFFRTVSFGESTCPCAGTHVKSISELIATEVLKVANKKGAIRVTYRA